MTYRSIRPIFAFIVCLFSLEAAALDLSINDENGRSLGTIYSPLPKILRNLPVGIQICSEKTVAKVDFYPQANVLPSITKDKRCTAINYLELLEDSTMTIIFGDGSEASQQLKVVDGFVKRNFTPIRIDRERFVTLEYFPEQSSALVCSNREVDLQSVVGHEYRSADEFQPVGRVKKASQNCFRIEDFRPLEISIMWELQFNWSDGEMIKFIDNFLD